MIKIQNTQTHTESPETAPITSGLTMPDQEMFHQAQAVIEDLPAYSAAVYLEELKKIDITLDAIAELEEEGASREDIEEYLIDTRAKYGSLVLSILSSSNEKPKEDRSPESSKEDIVIRLDKDKLRHTIHSFRDPEEQISIPVQEVVTESGVKFRVCDLRSEMTSSVRKACLDNQSQEAARLDAQILSDMTHAAETGMYSNTVTQANDLVAYSKVGGTNIRGYWMPVSVELDAGQTPDGVMTFARVADCGNTVGGEIDVYRRVFDITLRK